MKNLIKILLLNFLITNTTAQSLSWARGFGNTGDDFGNSIITDASGNVFTTGHFEGIVDFDPSASNYTLTSAGKKDIFISKLDASGNFQWALAFGDTGMDQGKFITNDSSGNVYVAGCYKGTIDFDPGPATNTLASMNENGLFILKINSSGSLIWAKSISNSGFNQKISLTIDNLGNVYATGQFNGTVDFNPGGGIYNLSSVPARSFVLKLDASGNFIWVKSAGGAGGSGVIDPSAIAVDASQNIYYTGRFFGYVIFDPSLSVDTTLSTGFSADIFISKLDANGNFVWAKFFVGSGPDGCNSITLDSFANVYICGAFSSTVNFSTSGGTYTLAAAGGNEDAFVSKLDSAGNLIWAKQLGGTGGDGAFSIIRDTLGNIYTAGWYSGLSDFDPSTTTYTLQSAGGFDAFISQLDTNGNFISAKSMGGTGSDYGNDITLDSSGNILVTGIYNNTCDFDPALTTVNLSSAGGNDAFVVKLANCSFAITSQPSNQISTIGNTAQFTTTSSNSNATFQWQEDTGNGFINVVNSQTYNGATTATLTISNLILAQNNYSFRCIVSESNCTSISNSALLNVYDFTGIEARSAENSFIVYPNPTNDFIIITTKKMILNSYILYDIAGKKVLTGKLENRETKIDLKSIPNGLYFISIGSEKPIKLVKQ